MDSQKRRRLIQLYQFQVLWNFHQDLLCILYHSTKTQKTNRGSNTFNIQHGSLANYSHSNIDGVNMYRQKGRSLWKTPTAWKVSVFGVILVRIFPHSDWMRRDTDQNNSQIRTSSVFAAGIFELTFECELWSYCV